MHILQKVVLRSEYVPLEFLCRRPSLQIHMLMIRGGGAFGIYLELNDVMRVEPCDVIRGFMRRET
jgi:hypothetical protein